MNLFKPNKLLLILLLILFSATSGFSYKKVKSFVLVAPEQVLPGVKRIAVLDFEGTKTYGEDFANYLISKLLEDGRGMHDLRAGFLGMGAKKEGKTLQDGTSSRVYDIVERSRMVQVMQEQQLGMSGLLDQSQAVNLGKMLGVQAIVMGKVQVIPTDRRVTETRSYKKNGKKYTKKVRCTKRMVNTVVTARIISTETGQILGSKESTQKMESKKCEGDYGNLKTVAEMVSGCLRNSSEAIANYFAPHYKLETYELEKIKTKPFKNLAEKAAKDAENLNIDAAYLKYKSIYDKDPYNPKILYNLGIMHEVVGNFRKADEFYQMAYQLKDEGKYEKAIKRVAKNVEFAKALAEMGVEIKEHEFRVTKAAMKQALAKKVEIKGKREERIIIYAQPQKGSEIVARVPGGVTFPVIKREGNWFLIKLLGGKQGYIHKDKVNMK